MPVWERWAWFRIEALAACRRRTRTTADLRELLELDRGLRHVQLRNQGRLVRGGFLERRDGGYRTTPRGVRVLEDLAELSLDFAGRPS